MTAAERMYIIVVGGGKVGFHLAKELVDSNYEVLVIEQDAEKAKEIADELGDIVIEGMDDDAATAPPGAAS